MSVLSCLLKDLEIKCEPGVFCIEYKEPYLTHI